MNNPFIILGITKNEAAALKKLTSIQRDRGLDILRRYFAWILHPDVTQNDGELLAQINYAIDSLRTDDNSVRYFNEYIESVPVSTIYNFNSRLNRERRYWKTRLYEKEEEYQRELHLQENGKGTLGT